VRSHTGWNDLTHDRDIGWSWPTSDWSLWITSFK